MARGEMKKISIPICFLLIFFLAACAINPVSGKRELSLISEKGEIALGKETDTEIRSQYGVYADPELNKYIQRIGTTMTPHTHRPHLTYHFAILDTPVVNAFAVPGGYIYVTRGILAMINSEAELAVVLGHELGHINARHSVRKLSKLILIQLGLAVGNELSETFAKISGVATIGIQLLFLKYSRSDERQADSLGIEYSRKGGYNPGEIVNFFSSLQKLGDLSSGQSLPGFLSTHPLTSERIHYTKTMLADEDRQLNMKHSSYLNHINNIVYGDDPRQGYVEGNTFFHPKLLFSFSFPKDWKLQNTPSKVVLASQDGKAAVYIQAEKSSEKLQDYAQIKTSELEGKQFINEQHLVINRMAAFQQLYNITQEEKDTLRMRLSLVRKGSYIFSFSVLSTSENFSKFDFQFGTLVGSFNRLKDETYINRKPKRIRLFRANGRETLQQIFRKAGMVKDLLPKFAIMNGIELDHIPERNQLIKIVE